MCFFCVCLRAKGNADIQRQVECSPLQRKLVTRWAARPLQCVQVKGARGSPYQYRTSSCNQHSWSAGLMFYYETQVGPKQQHTLPSTHATINTHNTLNTHYAPLHTPQQCVLMPNAYTIGIIDPNPYKAVTHAIGMSKKLHWHE